jgi:1,4-alpha-glucan branching enzyme
MQFRFLQVAAEVHTESLNLFPMSGEEIEAIVGGYHGDSFRVLGPHVVRNRGAQPRWEVRAFLPQAKSAAVLLEGQRHPMQKAHDHGFYVALLPGKVQPYRIVVEHWDGGTMDFDDPYRFPPLLTGFDLHLYGEGTHYEAYNTFGAHLAECDGVPGARFAVWAPNAENVCLIGDFNGWDARRHPMRRRSGGVWELFLPGAGEGWTYKYYIRSQLYGHRQEKADPFAFQCEMPPKSASVVIDLSRYEWGDSEWMANREGRNWLKEPVTIYEVHLGSWLRRPDGYSLSYREMADNLVEYVRRMGYTHVELLPPMEHPFFGSWGYQLIGYYAPSARYGSALDFMYLIDRLHQAEIGVIIDWVPAHFPKDAHGLAHFDGTALYEHEDPRRGEHTEWGTKIFNFGRNEVRAYLISNALFWLKKYHIDGLRVDAVASMLYLDYSRRPGEWIPNQYGGNENLEAIDFLKRFNEVAHTVPGAFTVAEESTSFTGVSRPVYLNGLGFTMKWNMGWMHDMLHYFKQDPVHRKYHHNDITFSLIYAFTENFVLPVSHDEVVYLKGSLIGKMPGDEWQKFANVRAFLAYMYAHPGKKLSFMGAEVGQYEEWNHDGAIRWDLLEYEIHRKLQHFVMELNRFYRESRPLYEVDYHWAGFEWVDLHDVQNSIISFIRRAENASDYLLFCCNFTPVVREGYGIGVPEQGVYEEVLNTDAIEFGGSGVGNGPLESDPEPRHGRPYSISATLPPLAVMAFRKKG